MAETLSPCRFKSWIKTISPSVITCLPLPFGASRWGVSAAADLRGACPPQIGPTALKLGNFQTALLGRLRSALTTAADGLQPGTRDENGLPDMAMLRSNLAAGRGERFTGLAFDILYLDGFDLRPAPLLARKQLLGTAGRGQRRPALQRAYRGGRRSDPGSGLRYGPGGDRQQAARCAVPLRPDRDLGQGQVQTAAQPSRSSPSSRSSARHPRKVASLYVGRWDGTGCFMPARSGPATRRWSLAIVRERLDPYIRRTSPLTVPVVKPKATWVEPVLEAEVDFTTTTGDGLLREAVFKGLR